MYDFETKDTLYRVAEEFVRITVKFAIWIKIMCVPIVIIITAFHTKYGWQHSCF